jgi:hypothetical protein
MNKQDLIDKHREINVDGDWWYESVYEWFEEECKARGVYVATTRRYIPQRYGGLESTRTVMKLDISWSGFWSQGDGAAFAGGIDCVGKALAPFGDDYPILQKYIEEVGGYFSFDWGIGRGNNIQFNNVNYERMSSYLDDHPLAEIWDDELEKEMDKAECVFRDLADDLCSLLYQSLRDEYDALTTDEAVWEAILANNLDEEIEDEQRSKLSNEELLQNA